MYSCTCQRCCRNPSVQQSFANGSCCSSGSVLTRERRCDSEATVSLSQIGTLDGFGSAPKVRTFFLSFIFQLSKIDTCADRPNSWRGCWMFCAPHFSCAGTTMTLEFSSFFRHTRVSDLVLNLKSSEMLTATLYQPFFINPTATRCHATSIP